MTLKSRSYSVTVHTAHLDSPPVEVGPPVVAVNETGGGVAAPNLSNRESAVLTFGDWLDKVGQYRDEGIIDYSVVSLETSQKGLPHLQGFFVFNETALEEGKKPTDYLSGHWTKARSLSGARDYCAAVGIHIKKPDLYGIVEYGQWVDPGWNQTLRSRLIYQMAAELEHGATYSDLAVRMPAAVLLVGTHNLSNLEEMRSLAVGVTARSLATEPYCYIGRTFLMEEFLNDDKTLLFLEMAEAAVEEE